MSASQPLTGDDHVEVNQLPGMFAPVPEKSWCAADGQPWPCPTVASQPLTGDEDTDAFIAAFREDDNEWWATPSGDLLNHFEELLDTVERLRAQVAQARQWIVNCVDPAEVGVDVKQQMLDDLGRAD